MVFARAERGLDLDTFLRMQRDAHDALQPAKDEEKDLEREPIRPVFRRAEPKPKGKAPTATARAGGARARRVSFFWRVF